MAAAPALPLHCYKFAVACIFVAIISLAAAPAPSKFAPLFGRGTLATLLNKDGPQVEVSGAGGHLIRVVVRTLGTKVRLKCAIKSSKISWTKDGVAIPCEEGGCRATLRLVNVTRHDAGMYQCWRPRGRLVPPSIRLKITEHQGGGRPKLMGPWPSNVTVVAGAPASLRCRVHSSLPPNIQWLRRLDSSGVASAAAYAAIAANKTIQYEGNTYEVLSSSGEAALANHSYLTKLLLAHTTEDDTGFYVCLATNNHGFRYRGAHVTVLPRSPTGVIVSQGLLNAEVALIVLVVILVGSPLLALMYILYAHRQALLSRTSTAL